jgi:hypothetical protein
LAVNKIGEENRITDLRNCRGKQVEIKLEIAKLEEY